MGFDRPKSAGSPIVPRILLRKTTVKECGYDDDGVVQTAPLRKHGEGIGTRVRMTGASRMQEVGGEGLPLIMDDKATCELEHQGWQGATRYSCLYKCRKPLLLRICKLL